MRAYQQMRSHEDATQPNVHFHPRVFLDVSLSLLSICYLPANSQSDHFLLLPLLPSCSTSSSLVSLHLPFHSFTPSVNFHQSKQSAPAKGSQSLALHQSLTPWIHFLPATEDKVPMTVPVVLHSLSTLASLPCFSTTVLTTPHPS